MRSDRPHPERDGSRTAYATDEKNGGDVRIVNRFFDRHEDGGERSCRNLYTEIFIPNSTPIPGTFSSEIVIRKMSSSRYCELAINSE